MSIHNNAPYIRRAVVLLFVATAVLNQAFAQVIQVSAGRFQVDEYNRLIVCNQLPAASPTAYTAIQLNDLYTLQEPTTSCRLGERYAVRRNDITYSLYFTKFPLIAIDTRGKEIVREAVTAGSWTLTDTLGHYGSSPIAINVRGAYSASFPKKSYKVDFYNDQALSAKKDTALFGMREDSEWLLLAMYNESARVNNVTTHALWLKMHKLYYQSQEPDAVSGVRTRYVDVFVNGGYNGVYALTEPVDRKQLKLKKTRDNGQARGELYKAVDWTFGTLFYGIPEGPETIETWGGFELKYPNDVLFWNNLRGLIEFTARSEDASFKSQISSRFKLDNVIDYFLFLNLIRATDNWGKNLYIARYKENEPYFFVPWDLDGTWGYTWSGDRDNVTDDILSNNLFNRLLNLNPEKYKGRMKKRWLSLRASHFSATSLKNALAQNTNVLTQDGAYLRERTRWPVGVADDDLAYMSNWIDRRLSFLDSYFEQFPDECTSPAAPTVVASATSVTGASSVTLTASGCTGSIIWNTGQTGNPLVVNPSETTAYWAKCALVDLPCESVGSTPVSISVITGMPEPDEADLALTSVVDKRILALEEPAVVTLSLANRGPNTARNVRVQNRLPAGLLFTSSSSTAVSHNSGIVSIELNEVLADQTIDIPIIVRPVTSGTFRNAAQVMASTSVDPTSRPGSGTGDGEDDMTLIDLRTANGSTAVTTSANPNQFPLPTVQSNQPTPSSTSADLSLLLTTDKRVLLSGQTVTLSLTVRNRGGLSATGVGLRCTLPAGLSLVSGEGVSVVSDGLTMSNLTIPASEAITVQLVLQATAAEVSICRAQILASAQSDPDSTPGNGYENGEDDEAFIDLRIDN